MILADSEQRGRKKKQTNKKIGATFLLCFFSFPPYEIDRIISKWISPER